MNALGNIDIAVLNGTSTQNYDRIADNMHRRAVKDSRIKGNVIKYHTNGLNNNTFKNIDAIVNGLDFVGFAGDGSIEDSEMLRSHLVRTKDIIDSAPQMFSGYQQPHQLSAMLGFVLDNWDTPDREAAIDNMAREERKLMAIGAIKTGNESDAHYLTDDEIYDADRQDVVRNGMVETKPGYRGLFNRIKAAGVNANVLSKDAEVVTDNTLTRKAVGTLREAVKMARKDRPKLMRKTRIKNGYVHTSVLKLPQQTATTADTIKILSRTPEGKKLAENIKQPAVNGLGEIEQGTLTELLHGTDFAFNGTDGLSGVDNIDNYRRYFIKLKYAIADNPKGFYNSKDEANAVIGFIDALYAVIGNDAAMDNLLRRYSQGINGVCSGAALGALGGKLKNALKKVGKAAKKTVTNVAKTTANATKQVAKTTANVTKAAVKATGSAVKTAAKATADAGKTVAKTTANAAKIAANTTANAAKTAAKATVSAGKTVAKATGDAAKTAAKATVSAGKTVAKATGDAAKTVAKTTANAAKTGVKAVVSTGKSAVQSTVNATKAAANVVKAGVQAATGNKNAAKESLQKAVSQAKAAVTQPIKTTVNVTKEAVKTTVVEPTKAIAKTTANTAKDVVKTTVDTTKAIAKTTANTTKAIAKTTANTAKDVAKTTAKAVKDTVKKTVVEPTKAIAKTTANVAKEAAKTTKDAAKTVAKETKDAIKNTVVEPTKTVVNETIVKPTKAALKITKKVTKSIGKVAKKVLKAILFYNPISLLVKAGLIIAFRLNMFKMASRSYAGSFTEEEFAKFAEKNGIINDADNYEKFQKSYAKCKRIYCELLGGKESKLLEALKKGSSRKWSGLDAADYTEENKDQFTAQVNEAANEADNSKEFTAEMTDINKDITAEESELKAKGVQASADAPTDQLIVEREVETTEMVDTITNGKILKADTKLYEAADNKSKQLAALKKGDTVYVDETQAEGNYVAVATIDGKNGFVDKSLLADFSSAEGVAINGVAGLVDNGYEYVAGLGEVVTAAAATTAASGSIASICAAIGTAFTGGLTMITKIADGVKTVADVKNAIDELKNDGNDEIEETEISQQPIQPYQPSGWQSQPPVQPQYPTPQVQPQQASSGIGKVVLIGAGVAAVAGLGIFLATRN